MEAKYGLDKPVGVQMVTWIGDFAKGDLGVSFRLQKNRPVKDIILDLFPTSAKIGFIALAIAVIFGIPLGCVAAYHRGRWVDSLLQVITTLGIAIPSFVLASILLVIFGVYLKMLPTLGLASWQSYLLPWIVAENAYPKLGDDRRFGQRLERIHPSNIGALCGPYARSPCGGKGICPVSSLQTMQSRYGWHENQ